jgi:hypothetical protein
VGENKITDISLIEILRKTGIAIFEKTRVVTTP